MGVSGTVLVVDGVILDGEFVMTKAKLFMTADFTVVLA